jgi:hypothetical protein
MLDHKTENPARMLPGKAQSEASRPNRLAACSTDASVDIYVMSTIDAKERAAFCTGYAS